MAMPELSFGCKDEYSPDTCCGTVQQHTYRFPLDLLVQGVYGSCQAGFRSGEGPYVVLIQLSPDGVNFTTYGSTSCRYTDGHYSVNVNVGGVRAKALRFLMEGTKGFLCESFGKVLYDDIHECIDNSIQYTDCPGGEPIISAKCASSQWQPTGATCPVVEEPDPSVPPKVSCSNEGAVSCIGGYVNKCVNGELIQTLETCVDTVPEPETWSPGFYVKKLLSKLGLGGN